MVNALVLAVPDFTQPFILETDASDKGIGAVLMQNRRPIAFMSKAIGVKAQGLSTYEKEFLALIAAVQKWRYYLIGRPFVIRTDQISLKHLVEQRVNHMVQHKGLCKLMGMDFKVEYKKGVENKVADALSRKHEYKGETEMELTAVSELIPKWVDEVKDSYLQDPWIQEINEKSKKEGEQCKFSQINGVWRYKGRICVGSQNEWRERIIKEIHNSGIGGHSGVLVICKRIKAIFYWPHMRDDVYKHIQACTNCQQNKSEHVKLPGLLQPLPIPNEAWNSISMDFITGLPRSEGKDVIFVAVDRLTKYAHFMSLRHPFKAADVAQQFLETVYRLHGLPENVISDRDPVFTSKFWQELMGKLGVKLNMSSAYHPQTDGQTERVNQCIENYLRCMLFNQPKHWHKWLPLAEYWYNTNFHSALKTTPFQALYGYAPPQLPLGSPPKSTVEGVNELMSERHKWIRELKEQLRKAQDRMKRFSDLKRSERSFKIGDWVYVKIQPYRQITVQGRNCQKLSPKYYGPFEIIAKLGTVAYELNLPAGTQIHPVFHVSQLREKVGNEQNVTPTLPLTYPSLQLKEEPEGILGRRMIKRKNEAVAQILIKWLNKDVEEASWEDYDEIKNKFPAFILRDKDNFERGGMSGSAQQRLLAVETVDPVNSAEEKRGKEKQSGQAQINRDLSLASGTRDTGRGTEALGQERNISLTKGPSEGAVKEINGMDGL